MSANQQDHSTRRAIWWTRSFARPLQTEFASDDLGTPDDMRDLLEQADKRLGPLSDRRNKD